MRKSEECLFADNKVHRRESGHFCFYGNHYTFYLPKNIFSREHAVLARSRNYYVLLLVVFFRLSFGRDDSCKMDRIQSQS